MALTPQEAAQKWATRLSQATPEIQKGIQRVTVSPTQSAAAKKDKMLANLTKAVQDGKWERGLLRVSLNDWQQATINKGLPRIAQGATAGTAKMQQFMSELLPYQATLQQQINNMPDLTLEDSINRMVAFTRGMSQFKRS